MRVLMVDDDRELCGLLGELLKQDGWELQAAHDGKSGLERALNGQYNLIVLDVMLPGMDGFEVLRRLRQKSQIPVLMLTARGDETDRIVGLEMGADDYLPKPFHPRELTARLRAIARRQQASNSQEARLEISGVVLDPGSREVTVDGEPVELTTFEFDILDTLMRSAGRVLSRDALMERLYGRQSTPFDRSIDMHVSHLRRKLGPERNLIRTVRGVGYQFSKGAEEVTA